MAHSLTPKENDTAPMWPPLSLDLPDPAGVAALRRAWRCSDADLQAAERLTLHIAAYWQWLAGMDLYGEHLAAALPDLRKSLYHVAHECYRLGRGGAPLSDQEQAQLDTTIEHAWGGQLASATAAAERGRSQGEALRHNAAMQAAALDAAWTAFGAKIHAPVDRWLEAWAPEWATWRARFKEVTPNSGTALTQELLTQFLGQWAGRRKM
jgi:hypothetical protein